MLNILTMFRHRRLPRRKRKAANGGWHINLGSLGESISRSFSGGATVLARGRAEPESPSRAQPRRRRDPVAERPASREFTGYLAAHGVEKSYGGRKVVKDVSLYVRARRGGRPARARTAPARPRSST